MVLFSSFCFELQVLTGSRPAYQKLARAIRPIAAVARRGPRHIGSPRNMPRMNEKQEVWLERTFHWWRLYRSLTRALGLLSRVYSWSAVAS